MITNPKTFKVISLIFILIAFTKCTVDKRIYTKGYNFSWHNTKSQNKSTSNSNKAGNISHIKDFRIETSKSEDILLLASTNKSYHALTKKALKTKIQLPNDSCGDLIIMKNGDEIKAKIFEINQKTIKYKKCNNLNGPLYVESNESVFMIKYANGTKEIIKQQEKEQVQVKQTDKTISTKDREINKTALISFICSCLFFVPFASLAAIILSIIARQQFKKNPNMYKSEWMYFPGLILAWIALVLMIIVVIFFIALLMFG